MRRAGFAAAALLSLATAAGAGEFTVGSGASVDLGTGSLDLGCANLTVAGTLSGGTAGFVGARDITIDPSGVVNGNAATLSLAGDWDNAGTFNAGTSTVKLVDGCGLASAVVAGDTTFSSLAMETTSGFLYRFAHGSTQTVTDSLSLMGEAGSNRLQIRSTLDGSEAFLDAQGSRAATDVDVEDNDAAAGKNIILGGDSVKGTNATGWLLASEIPLLPPLALVTLALSLLWGGRRVLARRIVRAARS